MIASQRIMYILQQINKKGIINLKDIAKELDISEATVRRDFEKLEKQGKLKRVTGGAASSDNIDDLMNHAELSMREKTAINSAEKQKVASFAATQVKEGDCIFLDGGTSIAPMAEILATKRIKIVTYSNLVLKRLSNPMADIFIVGGQFIPQYDMFVGAVAQDVLGRFHFDHAFIGCAGVDLTDAAVYTTEVESMKLKLLAMERSTKKHLLLDDSKLEKRGFFEFANLQIFDTVFCNQSSKIKLDGEGFVIV